MTDIQIEWNEHCRKIKVLFVAFEFRNMPYLVADKYGNFFTLPHFNKLRTTEFKKLNRKEGYIYYNGNKVRMSTLYKRVISTSKKIIIGTI